MNLPYLDHIGIAVSNLDEALAFYRDALGLEIDAPEEVASQRVRAHFIPAGDAALELLEATATIRRSRSTWRSAARGCTTSRFASTISARRLRRLKAKGVRLIDELPREGAHGSLVAFVHPASAHGVLVELKQAGDRGKTAAPAARARREVAARERAGVGPREH